MFERTVPELGRTIPNLAVMDGFSCVACEFCWCKSEMEEIDCSIH